MSQKLQSETFKDNIKSGQFTVFSKSTCKFS
jgi:hypothetical protein